MNSDKIFNKKEMGFVKRLIRSFKIYTDMMNEIKLKIDDKSNTGKISLDQKLEAIDNGLFKLAVCRQHVVMALNNMFLCKVPQHYKHMTFTDGRVEELSGGGGGPLKLLIPIIFMLFVACSNASGMFSLFGLDTTPQSHGKLPLALHPQSLASVTSLTLGLHFKDKMQEEKKVEIGSLSLLQLGKSSPFSWFGENPLSNAKKTDATTKINTALQLVNHDLNNFCRNDLRTMDFAKFIKDLFEKFQTKIGERAVERFEETKEVRQTELLKNAQVLINEIGQTFARGKKSLTKAPINSIDGSLFDDKYAKETIDKFSIEELTEIQVTERMQQMIEEMTSSICNINSHIKDGIINVPHFNAGMMNQIKQVAIVLQVDIPNGYDDFITVLNDIQGGIYSEIMKAGLLAETPAHLSQALIPKLLDMIPKGDTVKSKLTEIETAKIEHQTKVNIEYAKATASSYTDPVGAVFANVTEKTAGKVAEYGYNLGGAFNEVRKFATWQILAILFQIGTPVLGMAGIVLTMYAIYLSLGFLPAFLRAMFTGRQRRQPHQHGHVIQEEPVIPPPSPRRGQLFILPPSPRGQQEQLFIQNPSPRPSPRPPPQPPPPSYPQPPPLSYQHRVEAALRTSRRWKDAGLGKKRTKKRSKTQYKRKRTRKR